MNIEDMPYGPVKIIDGIHTGRIGYYDDDEIEFDDDIDWQSISEEEVETIKGRDMAIVYFGDMIVTINKGPYLIPAEYIRPVTIDDLMKRREELYRLCGGFKPIDDPDLILDEYEQLDYCQELHYVDTILLDRIISARYSDQKGGAKVFISHSSKDKVFARWISTDLKAAGHTPWFDEWDISVGESIPQKISQGIEEADFVIVILSEDAINSHWVEREWQAKYWDEVQKRTIQVLPVLYQDCELPALLKTKRYADFRHNYNIGLEDILSAITKFQEKDN
ncbi:MAG: toll/interleukin-1 receptor domain-containing protein [Cyanobacteria bacterium P01_G01_bin.49]